MLLPLASWILLTAPVPAPQETEARCARVVPAGGVVRAFFDADSPEVLAAPAALPLRVVEIREPWARVQAPGGFDVWVHGDYLKWSGADGEVTRANVNARPLPSTEPPSTPLGRLSAGDRVVRVGHEGAWFRVRAPEGVGGWIRLTELELLESAPADWDAAWAEAARARAPAREEPPAPAPAPPPEPKPEPAPAGGEPAASGARAGVSRPEPAAARVSAFPPAQVAKEPARWLSLAHQDLAEFRGLLAAGFERWDAPRAADLETAFTTVLWHGTQPNDLESARHGLASLDALSRSYGAWIAAGERRARDAGDAVASRDWEARAAALARAGGEDGEGGALFCGWAELRPGAPRGATHQLTRNGRSVVAHDYDGRWKLSDFAGREVVVRGAWREDPSVPGGRVIAISEARLLPVPPPR